MKRFNQLAAVLAISAVLPVTSALAKDDGVASLPVNLGPFPDTANIQFLGQVTPDEVGALPVPGVWAKGMMNDIGGWTSTTSGEEYVLATNSGGIGFIRITDPRNPVYLGKIGSQAPLDFRNIWGDPATFGNFGYFVTEIGDSNVVIVDLSGLDGLPAATSPDFDLEAAGLLSVTTFNGGGYNGSHNVVVNEATGYAYLAGVHLKDGAANNACGAEEPARFNLLVLDLNANPAAPSVAACFDDVGEHDLDAVKYNGPDTEHVGKEILFVFDGRDRRNPAGAKTGGLTKIWDVSDKANVVEIASFEVPGLVFSHNGTTTEEQDFLFIGDELDELVLADWVASGVFAQPVDNRTNKPATGTFIMDIRDLDNPVLVERFEHDTIGIDHNFVVKDDKLYLAAYTSGTRVVQINRDSGGGVSLTPYGHMDTEPRLPNKIMNIRQEERFGSSFLGQWGMYAFDSSDTVIASDLNNGVIIMRLSDEPCKGIRCSFQ